MQNTMTMTAEDWGRRIDRANLWPAALLLLLLIVLGLLGLGPRADCCAPMSAAAKATSTSAGALAPPAAPSSAPSSAPIKAEPLLARLEADGKLILTGTVASEAQRKALVEAAAARVGTGNVLDRLVVGAPAAAGIRIEGEVADEAMRSAWGQAFTQPGLELDNRLQVRPAPVAQQAAALPVVPAARIYFRTGKAEIDAAGEAEIARIADALKAHTGRKAVISGFHDERGDPARNAELAKRRAQAVAEALRDLGIDAGRIELRKPSETLGGANRKEARRVELSLE